MTRTNVAKLGRLASRGIAANRAALLSAARTSFPRSQVHNAAAIPYLRSAFSTSARLPKPLTDDERATAVPATLTDAQYHELADDYLERLLTKYEAIADETGEIDVEYSSGVMNVSIPNAGTYVLNKQPPNKQIWLSSPKTGPKRYDYVVISEGQDQKQDTAKSTWVYMRDHSTLNELLLRETGVNMEDDIPSAGGAP
ncbi:mitochondrial chaperone Frataxin [Xylariaceae sp. FL0016]|nr:mitochondrial chaperone Frataxin [Xylariaceae sp. FL0016]